MLAFEPEASNTSSSSVARENGAKEYVISFSVICKLIEARIVPVADPRRRLRTPVPGGLGLINPSFLTCPTVIAV
jgi:hypothetical protein